MYMVMNLYTFLKKMYYLDYENIEYVQSATRSFVFGMARNSRMLCHRESRHLLVSDQWYSICFHNSPCGYSILKPPRNEKVGQSSKKLSSKKAQGFFEFEFIRKKVGSFKIICKVCGLYKNMCVFFISYPYSLRPITQ